MTFTQSKWPVNRGSKIKAYIFGLSKCRRVCFVAAARLGDGCEYDNACAFSDDNTACVGGKCDCIDGFRAAQHLKGAALCLPASTVTFLENNYLMTTISAVAGLVIFTALLCLVLRLFSKARFNRPADRMASAGSPPTMMSAFTGSRVLDSRRASRSSSMGSTDYAPVSRRASYSVLAPPSSLGSRRASSTSVRSGLSFRTNSSFRGYRSSREPVRRALSSPADSSTNFPPSPCKVPNHHHHHHPIHHNSPVDEDDILDVR
ncbi:EB domain-containing protein [Nephila pilipes]|uniref:EB domain-containing protein n=2 Tax=Nephila pilipes TaxID=299642 RepID=A0A8X6PK68_NEPPI|nr:EB domain-containing protein [Nephila pilipes]